MKIIIFPETNYLYKMSNTHTSIHDNFIRAILSSKTIATEYFRNYLPESISSKLNFSTLTQIPDTYLSDQLKKSISDIVFSCEKNDTPDVVKICLLIEHKSYPDKYTPLQIGHYIFSGLQKQVENKEELSIIIPVLLYHGKGKWKYQTLASLFKNPEPEWKQYLPDFEYIYNNLGEISDEQVETLNNKFLLASILALKHSFEKEWLKLNARRILLLISEESEKLQKSFVIYLFINSGLEEEAIEEIIHSLPITLKDTIMNTLDIFIEKGKKIGMERGIQTGIEIAKLDFVESLLRNTDFSTVKIAELTGVSEMIVNSVLKQINDQQ
ncbi:Rpn family recombination-promoting nuclease/putative transposase [Dyadobacter sp. CY345]|uniref:Rpn family recombination-promoting nuclease/putative transposase n=1 Tax=Dyadobacter sp. CY345 TaxID=2909335 RepID=UPI001F488F89|nr:Rpn family recombination-promoting nuclease/putative transposase [Dyadobacter sp. CY345]